MSLNQKPDIKLFLIKITAALAISFAGFIYSRLKNKSSNPSVTKTIGSSDQTSKVDKGGESDREEDHPSQSTSAEMRGSKNKVGSSIFGTSASSRHIEDREGFNLRKFKTHYNPFELATNSAGYPCTKYSPRSDFSTTRAFTMSETGTSRSDYPAPRAFPSEETFDYKQEIERLNNIIRMLQEKERNLEVQLMEFNELKKRETTVTELQNRLNINLVEAKYFNLKIESLQVDNKRLEAQVVDHAKVVADLESTRSKVKMLKKKLRFEAQQNKDQILSLQRRVSRMQEQERDTSGIEDRDIQKKLQRINDLELEAEQLRKSNTSLQLENSELGRRLDSTQLLAHSVLEDAETDELKQQSNQLRLETEELKHQIESLQADRCSDAEELVYLRWLNACLRFELRHYQPAVGRTVARDLSKSLSPKSEEKAKQLIMEYAYTEGGGEKGININDFDSDQWSSTDAGDESPLDTTTSATKPSKRRIFEKIKRILLGKDSHHKLHHQVSNASSETWDSPGCSSVELQNSRHSTPQLTSRHSLDIQKLMSPNKGDYKEADKVKDMGFLSFRRLRTRSHELQLENQMESELNSPRKSEFDSPRKSDLDSPRKSDLSKYADALKDSPHHKTWHKKSTSYNFGDSGI